jgi:hypothetical protein
MDLEYRLRGIHSNNKFNGRLWSKALILFLWDELWAVWSERNDTQYAKDDETKTSFQREDATNKITKLYSYKDSLLANDRNHLLMQPLDELLKHKTMALRDWIVTNELAIKRAISDAEKYQRTTNQDISQLLSPDLMPP